MSHKRSSTASSADSGGVAIRRSLFRSRFFRRLAFVAIAFPTLLFLAHYHFKGITYDVENKILRYLSLSTEEQTLWHDHQLEVLRDALRQCAWIAEKPVSEVDIARSNPRAVPSALPILIRNASLVDGDGTLTLGVSILLDEGVVKEIGEHIDHPKNAKVINVRGRYVTPGLVDMHSHAGVDTLPELWGVSDYNEIAGDVTPYARTIDAINPSDEMFTRIPSGGVTTSLILPGSANNIGGEAYVLKLRKVPTVSVEDMLIQYNVTTKHERWIKMACGENPKRVYGTPAKWEGGPNTRMGEAWKFRQTFDRARALVKAQDEWCIKAAAAASTGNLATLQGQEFPSALELDVVVGVLRGDVRVNVHCYETFDLEAMLRHASEFNFQVTAFHHALDAWRVPDMIKRASQYANRNITIATFGMLWGFKKEGFQANPWTGKILSDHDIPIAYKSDHPVLNAQHLLYEAQIGHHYGLKESLAIASLTSVPAKAIGMDHRIGYVRVGYDADVVIWDAYPLSLGAVPVQVFIDGVELFDEKIAERKLETEFNPAEGIPRQREWDETEAMNMDGPKIELEKKDFVATGIKKAYIRGEDGLESLSATGESLTMVVRNGSITCLSSSCESEMHSANIDGVPIRHFNNGYILPGLTLLSPSHGLAEIVSERTTLDGLVDSSKDPKDTKSVIYAKDGLTFGGKHLERAHAAGILNLVTAPLSNGFSQGVSVAFKSGGDSVLQKGAVIKENVALHFQISHDSNGGSTPTISSQLATLKQILLDSVNDTDSIYGRAANGQIPLAITAQNKDIIAHLLDLKASISKTAPINLVLIGGIEAYLLADEIAAAKVPVILAPWRCQPESWEIRNCLPGPPLSEKTSFQILLEAGVDVALAAWDDGLIVGMYWEASWAARGTELTEKDVVKLISTDVERILGIEFEDSKAGYGGGHVLFEGNPLDFGANVAAIIP